jgi:Protein of unknown function (DUF2637)
MSNEMSAGPAPVAGDRLIGWSATASVVVVTAIAAVISYGHARELVLRYGVTGWTADALPLTIDGVVATCSLILVDCARHDRQAPWQAWFLLIIGACATVSANVAAGLSYGVVGAAIAGWPALVACGCFDLLLRHRRHRVGGAEPLTTADQQSGDPAIDRARELYAPALAQGRAPAIRAIKRDLHVGTPRATAIRDAITATVSSQEAA